MEASLYPSGLPFTRLLRSYRVWHDIPLNDLDIPLSCAFSNNNSRVGKFGEEHGDLLAVGSLSGRIYLTRLHGGCLEHSGFEPLRYVQVHRNIVLDMQWIIPNLVYSSGAEGSLAVTDIHAMVTVDSFKPDYLTGFFHSIGVSTFDPNLLLVASSNSQIAMFDRRCTKQADSYKPVLRFDAFASGRTRAAVQPGTTGVAFLDHSNQMIGVTTVKDTVVRVFDTRRTFAIKRSQTVARINLMQHGGMASRGGINRLISNQRQLQYFFSGNSETIQLTLSGPPCDDYDFVRAERSFKVDRRCQYFGNARIQSGITSDFRQFMFATDGRTNTVHGFQIAVDGKPSNFRSSHKPWLEALPEASYWSTRINVGTRALTSLSLSDTHKLAICSGDGCVYLLGPTNEPDNTETYSFLREAEGLVPYKRPLTLFKPYTSLYEGKSSIVTDLRRKETSQD